MKSAIITAIIVTAVVITLSTIACLSTLNIMDFDGEQMAYGMFAMAAAAAGAREYIKWSMRGTK